VYFEPGDGHSGRGKKPLRLICGDHGAPLSTGAEGEYAPAFSSVKVILHPMDRSTTCSDAKLIPVDGVPA
jgi:hypothetical protein